MSQEQLGKWLRNLSNAGYWDLEQEDVDRLQIIADRLERPGVEGWPTDNPRLWYDHFAKTWTIKGLLSEIFTDRATEILGCEPEDAMPVNVKVLVTPAPKP